MVLSVAKVEHQWSIGSLLAKLRDAFWRAMQAAAERAKGKPHANRHPALHIWDEVDGRPQACVCCYVTRTPSTEQQQCPCNSFFNDTVSL